MEVISLKVHQPETRPKEDSLLRMFRCELFTADMLMLYLLKKFKNPGIHSYLVNKLYSLNKQDMKFYMLEICYMVIIKQSKFMEKFLEDYCKQDMALFFQILWLTQSLSEGIKNKQKMELDRVERLEGNLEQGMINGERLSLSRFYRENDEDSLNQLNLLIEQQAITKGNRTEYTNFVKQFITQMTKISLVLKKQTKQQRKESLPKYLGRANQFIQQKRKDWANDHYFNGIVVPFQNHHESNLIVRVIENEFTCFETKKRVPYRCVIETIDVKDLQDGYRIDTNKMAQEDKITGHEKLEEFYQQNSQNDLDLESEEQIMEEVKKYKDQKYGTSLKKFVKNM